MATVTRQPFAPLDGSRLQTLTSLKNRQNAIPSQSASAGKRKAELLEVDDSENVDPLLFAKRSKGSSGASHDLLKPSSFVLSTKSFSAASTPLSLSESRPLASPKSSLASRRTLQPKSPISRLNTTFGKVAPSSAPAGRSPTRGKRSGILNTRRRSGPYTRVDPPAFNLGGSAGAPFSLDAALKGTIPSYGARPAPKPAVKDTSYLELGQSDMKASWFFDIHEDTPEQDMTNLLQHSTCILDISSDEESERKVNREKEEGRDKENIPPVDDVSQTSSTRRARPNADEMVIEKERVALGEMNTADFYAQGCDETSVIIVPADDEDEVPQAEQPVERAPIVDDSEISSELKDIDVHADIDALMNGKSEDGSSKAAVLEPIEGTGESFELWESGSAKDDSEAVAVAAAVALESS
ncbi:hypothetical protein S40288_08924 [Stachybotrys chartarum IBT 40288]|nr:hypothetical protein S40288_08924 [Stachybotrys chartarum IBT 40288]